MVTAPETKRLKLEVSNFGPITEGTVELRPMTVFVGPSNTGKSYLAVLIYALHQFFGSYSGLVFHGRMPGHMLFRRPPSMMPLANVALNATDVDNIYSWVGTEQSMMETARQQSFYPNLSEKIADLVRNALGSVGSLGKVLDEEIVRCFGIDKTESLVHYSGSDMTGRSMRSSVSNVFDRGDVYRYEIELASQGTSIGSSIPDTMPSQIVQNVQTPWFFRSPEDPENEREDNARVYLAALAGVILSRSVGPLGRPAHYLPADRAGVMHAHQVAVRGLIASASRMVLRPDSPMPVLSGVLGDFLEQLVALDSGPVFRNRESNDELARQLERRLMGGAVRVERSQIDYPSFAYRPSGWQRDLPLMNASSMVSELAPVALYLRHVVQPGDTLIIEEPESHLHPESQVEFTRLLAAAVKAGIRIIITTHSEWVLEELANLVKLSELAPERRAGIEGADLALGPAEVGAWFFKPNGEKEGSVVEEIRLDPDSGTFPSGFGLVSEALYNRWVRITNRVELGE